MCQNSKSSLDTVTFILEWSLNTRKETDILYKFLQKFPHPAPLWSPSLLPLLESYSNVDHMPVVITPNNFACMVSIQRVCTCVCTCVGGGGGGGAEFRNIVRDRPLACINYVLN